MFGWDFSKAAMTSLSRSSSTLAPTQPLSDTVVTLAAPSFFAESGTEPPTIACEPDTRTTANSITVASKAPTVSRLRIHPLLSWIHSEFQGGKPLGHDQAPPRAASSHELVQNPTPFQVRLFSPESGPDSADSRFKTAQARRTSDSVVRSLPIASRRTYRPFSRVWEMKSSPLSLTRVRSCS